jgi:guanine deaminase
MEVVRAQVMHTPRDPFAEADALEAFSDGGLAFADGRIEAVGSFDEVRRAFPGARIRDERDAVLLPGLVDTHVHFPQLAIIGSMGLGLLDWLERYALPEEARMADAGHARRVAGEFVAGLAANGTTTALVFGSHFPAAQEALFEEAERSGLRIASGLVVSDRNLRPDLHVNPDDAYEAGRELAARWHGRGRLRYVVTPRFSLSCTEGMLEACAALQGEVGALVTSHMNENLEEVEAVRGVFGAFDDYLHTYEHFGLVGESTVLAHNVHPSEAELARLCAAGASVAHCPESNACLGSGLFPLNGHLEHGVRVVLGTDVGAGTGLSVLKEALTAYQLQMLRDDRPPLGPAHLLYLSTRAGAVALGVDEVGDLSSGRVADFVLIRPTAGSTLEAVLRHSDSPERTLGALFALAREESVAEVRVAGDPVSSPAGQTPPGGAGA